MRRFILSLPGSPSYCNCDHLCSKLEIEHVYPKSLLRKKLNNRSFSIANRDFYNLYSCCSFLNRNKADLLLGRNYDAEEFNGILARSCLYMNFSYNLKTDEKLIKIWKNYSILYPPNNEEYQRSEIIRERTGKKNMYIDDYPLSYGQ